MWIVFYESNHKFSESASILTHLTIPLKFQTKQRSTLGNSANFSYIPWKFQGQKPRPLEIPQYFFLVTHGNSTSLLINHWKLHMLFLWYLRKCHILNHHPSPLLFRVFPTGGNGGGVPLYQPKICSFPPVDSHHQILSPPPKVDPPTLNNNFQGITQ